MRNDDIFDYVAEGGGRGGDAHSIVIQNILMILFCFVLYFEKKLIARKGH